MNCFLKNLSILCVAFLVLSCGYKHTSNEGQSITGELVKRLQPNMSKKTVTLFLGQPLIKDIFHNDNRWDYVYIQRKVNSFDLTDQADTQENPLNEQEEELEDTYSSAELLDQEILLKPKKQTLSLFFENEKLKKVLWNQNKLFDTRRRPTTEALDKSD